MAKTEMASDGARTRWRNPVLRFEGSCPAPAEVVYELLADLPSHLDWAGRRQLETTRLLTLDAPSGSAGVGTEFHTTGSDGKAARWSDRSVVTEATRPQVFEFVTEGTRQGKAGTTPWRLTAIHRYQITPGSGGCRVVYTEELTRLTGAPRLLMARGVNRLLFRLSAKYMRRGFQGLLDLAAERAGAATA
jgi:polyketide cyclase/dehydrase/lipid transport protein